MRDQRRGEDLKNLKWQELQSANLASEERSEAKRFIRRMQQEDREREMEEALTKVCSYSTAGKQHCFVILLFHVGHCKVYFTQFVIDSILYDAVLG